MERALVSAAGGALKPVLEKLGALLSDKYKLFKSVRREIKFLKAELEAMHAFLENMSELEDSNVQDKAWMADVRELSYDTEDSIDEFMLRVDDKSAKPDGFIEKCRNLWMKTKTRHQIAKAIRDLKIQVKEVGERRARYKIRETISKTSNAAVDHRAVAIFEDASKLVGIDGPKDELIKLLMHGDVCASLQQPKVVSIIGSAGLGKTTLANQVYKKLGEQFECKSFVSVSQNPDMMKVLRIILSEVSNQPYASTEEGGMQQLIGKIANFLEDKRYLIVVDDVWKTDNTWNIIKCALFKNSKDSRIITTTRIHDVAKSCCSSDDHVYKMRPLSSMDSKRLFFKRIFGSEDECPSHLTEVSNKILAKCAGLPLAVISISGLLANKPQTENQWDQVQNSIGRTLGKSGDVDSMIQILSLSYFDLPRHLRTCLLYLAIFPEDYIIEKRCLVRRWIAEGFIHEERGHTLYDLGERCFNELINRSLIQPWEINVYGEAKACRVHDTILDFIISKSVEENFVTIFGAGYQMPGSHEKVRRLSLHASHNREEIVSFPTKLDFSHARSLTMFKNSVELASLLDMRFLRVVDLVGCGHVEGHHLANIGNLFQLKYLSLRNTGVSELPAQIGKLQYLETLDVRGMGVRELPATVIQLQRLSHLAIDKDVKLPDGIGSMTALEQLKCVNVFRQSIKCLQELGQLKHLRNVRLFLWYDEYEQYATGSLYKEYMDTIAASLCKLGTYDLRSVSINSDSRSADDFSLDLWGCTPCGLRKFVIWNKFVPKVPNWMGSLVNLQRLTLYVKEFEVEDLLALGRLPALEFLFMLVHESFEGKKVTISGNDGFQYLRRFGFGCAIPVTFEAGAMPKVETLDLVFNLEKTQLLVSSSDLSFGFQHLSSLHMVICSIHYDEAVSTGNEILRTVLALNAAKDAIKRALRSHPMFPELKLIETGDWMTEWMTRKEGMKPKGFKQLSQSTERLEPLQLAELLQRRELQRPEMVLLRLLELLQRPELQRQELQRPEMVLLQLLELLQRPELQRPELQRPEMVLLRLLEVLQRPELQRPELQRPEMVLLQQLLLLLEQQLLLLEQQLLEQQGRGMELLLQLLTPGPEQLRRMELLGPLGQPPLQRPGPEQLQRPEQLRRMELLGPLLGQLLGQLQRPGPEQLQKPEETGGAAAETGAARAAAETGETGAAAGA